MASLRETARWVGRWAGGSWPSAAPARASLAAAHLIYTQPAGPPVLRSKETRRRRPEISVGAGRTVLATLNLRPPLWPQVAK